MIDKTRGIVLHQIKFADSGMVIWIYTRKFGRRSFIVKGIRNRKQGKHNIYFQPLSILDMVVYQRESREMLSVKEFSAAFTPSDIYINITKTSMAIFLGEVLSSILKEEAPNEGLFDFIENSVSWFDNSSTGYSNFHIAFLSGLTSFLGFEPSLKGNAANKHFDLVNGVFVPYPPLHGCYADEQISEILSHFFASSYDDINNIILNGTMRNRVLETLVNYYSAHLPGLKKIRSLEVMRQVFS